MKKDNLYEFNQDMALPLATFTRLHSFRLFSLKDFDITPRFHRQEIINWFLPFIKVDTWVIHVYMYVEVTYTSMTQSTVLYTSMLHWARHTQVSSSENGRNEIIISTNYNQLSGSILARCSRRDEHCFRQWQMFPRRLHLTFGHVDLMFRSFPLALVVTHSNSEYIHKLVTM